MIRLRALGSLDLFGESGHPSNGTLQQPKRAALLVYLAIVAPDRFVRRDRLLALFWPELDLSHARDALNSAIRFLRRELGEDVLVSRGAEDVMLAPSRVHCDVLEFRRAVAARDYAGAIAQYQGDLLDGFHCDASPEFDEWLEQERLALRADAANAARAFSELRERDGNVTTAVACARRALALSNGDERIMRQLLELLDRLGDRAGALHAYEAFAKHLSAEFDAEPAPETRDLIARIRNKSSPSTPRATRAASDLPRIPGLTVERELGRGGMAIVYLAHDTRHNRPVAVKLLRPELAYTLGIERFLKEVRITARLAHPHILPLLDSGNHDGQLYFTTPFVPEGSLRNLLDRQEPLAIPMAMRLGRELASALSYAHRQGIIHRDVKPDNILLADGHAVVADFGIARAIAVSATAATASEFSLGIAMQSRAYQSPEQQAGAVIVDERCDLFALGGVLYDMFARVRPPVDQRRRQSSLPADVPRAVVALIMRCLDDDPARRPESARDVMCVLGEP